MPTPGSAPSRLKWTAKVSLAILLGDRGHGRWRLPAQAAAASAGLADKRNRFRARATPRPRLAQEETQLCECVKKSGSRGKWHEIAQRLNTGRTGKQCRER